MYEVRVPYEIQKRVDRLDNALFLVLLEVAFDRVHSGLDGQHADDADDDCNHRGREIVEKCAAAHAAACPGIQLRQTYSHHRCKKTLPLLGVVQLHA